MNKRLFLVVLSAPLLLVGCSNSKDGGKGTVKDGIRVSYSLESEGNIIRAEVNVKDGKASKVRFDEVCYEPKNVFNVANDNVSATATNTETINSVKYVKYLKVFDTIYTCTPDSEDHAAEYKNGTKDLVKTIAGLTKQEEIADYYYQFANGFVSSYDDVNGTTPNTLLDQTKLCDKASASSSYWTTGFGKHWKPNIAAIEKALTGKDLSKKIKVEGTGDNGKGPFNIDGEATGATISSTEAYVKAAVNAFNGSSNVTVSYGRDMIEGREKNGHCDCFVKAEVVWDGDKVKKAFINETDQFLTTASVLTDEEKDEFTAANYNNIHTDAVNNDDGTEKTPAKDDYYAKKMKVNDKVWEGSTKADSDNMGTSKEKFAFKNGSDNALLYYGKTVELSQEYYNAAFLHNIYRMNGDNAVSATWGSGTNGTATKAEKGNKYWNKPGTEKIIDGSQWKWNIDKLQKSLVNVDFSKDVTTEKVTEGWKINSTQSGATMTEYETFIPFVKTAYSYKA